MDASLLRQAWERSQATRWGVSVDDFGPALGRAVARTAGVADGARDDEEVVRALHLEDLALACGCALGRDAAWEHFVREYRPILRRVAGRNAPPDAAAEVADSLYAELFGLEERDGRRRSLFDYYHGRSTLASWLRAVVAQRLVDRARAGRRLEPLPEPGEACELVSRDRPPDVDRDRLGPAVGAAFKAAIAGLTPKDRLRLSLYYAQDLTLAAIGRMLGESEATASRKLQRTRQELRQRVERTLRDDRGLTEREVQESLEYGRTDPAFDLSRDLPPG